MYLYRLLTAFVVLHSVCPLPAAAEQDRVTRQIGVLNQAWASNHPAVEGLKTGLKERGFEEGRNLTFDIRFTEGDPVATTRAAAELVEAKVDLIFTINTAATKAALEATDRIPIVFTLVGDPVAAGIVTNMSRPGGNVTGVSGLSTELVTKRLEFLKAIVPSLRRVSAIHYAGDASSLAAIDKARDVAPKLGLQILSHSVRSREEVTTVLRSLPAGDALLAPPAETLDIPAMMLTFALSESRPTVFGSAIWVRYGALLSYGSDYFAEGYQAARLVTRILGGTRPQDLPVEGANEIELAVNMKTARSLGITLPRAVLFRANTVVR